jgi:hypothetical protein
MYIAVGMFLSKDGKEFVVASSIASILSFYNRDPATNKLTFREKMSVPFPPDNLRHGANGDILIAGSPHIPQMFEFAYGKRPYSPSWVATVSRRKPVPKGTILPPDDQKAPFIKTSDLVPQHPKYEFTSLYYSDGSQYACSSTAILDGEELIGMSLLGPGILHCKHLLSSRINAFSRKLMFAFFDFRQTWSAWRIIEASHKFSTLGTCLFLGVLTVFIPTSRGIFMSLELGGDDEHGVGT